MKYLVWNLPDGSRPSRGIHHEQNSTWESDMLQFPTPSKGNENSDIEECGAPGSRML
jgi:hypothetical protein